MRFFAVLAFAAALAAGSGCASNCTQNILGQCTPRFQWQDGSFCYLLNLAPPQAQLWEVEASCPADIDDYLNSTVTGDDAELIAWTTNFTVVDNTLAFETDDCCDCNERRASQQNTTISVSFIYASGGGKPKFCGSGCSRDLKLYTNWGTCNDNEITSVDNDVETTWRGSNSGSSRRNRASGRRNSASTTTGNDGTRRSGCANPLLNTVIAANETGSVCQVGQCCGDNFCRRERSWKDCDDDYSGAGWLVGPTCSDTTCQPKYGGDGNAAGGKSVTLGSTLEFALGSVPPGGRLDVQTLDVNEANSLPAPFVGGEVTIAFNVEREDENGAPIHGYLESGAYILVTIVSDALDGGDIVVLRWDSGSSSWVSTVEDCAHDPPKVDIAITYAAGVYTVPICHTSTFIVSSAEDSKDKKDKKDAKDLKVSKKKSTPTKVAKGTSKAPKDVEKKAAKKGKAEIAIGVGVAGGAVLLAGVGVLVRRRSNKKSKKPVATTGAANTEVAVVSV